MSKKRAAVVIGVNRTGGLPVLEGSASGADAVRAWLEAEGFEVRTFTDVDEKGNAREVTASAVKAAVKYFVKKGTYSQLVIFFSGHGYWKNDNEFWLLTGAPEDSEEAISWTETAELAKGCGIPNVVLISDACRTQPLTPSAMRIRGSVLIPNTEQAGPRSKVDKYLAAIVTNPAYELKLVGTARKTSIFTHCLLDAFSEPNADAVLQIDEAGEQISVVPNRKLGLLLQQRVPELLQSVKATYEQMPDAEVLSDEHAYIAKAGRIKTTAEMEGVEMPARPPITIKDVGSIKLWQKLGTDLPLSVKTLRTIEQVAHDSGFDDAVSAATPPDTVGSLATQCGITVRGTGISEVVVGNGMTGDILEAGKTKEPGIVMLPLSSVTSIGLRFTNGRATVIAGLPGYIAHLQVDGGAVVNLSYVPSENNFRWARYNERRTVIEELRATTAAAALKGVFRLGDKQKARAFAEIARIDKAFDPSLGIYSTYAYSQADDREAINSILQHIYDDIRAWIFDVALLAGRLRTTTNERPVVAPFCPMLTQGWNLLRLNAGRLPKVLSDAQDELEATLWTTFKPSRAEKIINAMREGRLK